MSPWLSIRVSAEVAKPDPAIGVPLPSEKNRCYAKNTYRCFEALALQHGFGRFVPELDFNVASRIPYSRGADSAGEDER